MCTHSSLPASVKTRTCTNHTLNEGHENTALRSCGSSLFPLLPPCSSFSKPFVIYFIIHLYFSAVTTKVASTLVLTPPQQVELFTHTHTISFRGGKWWSQEFKAYRKLELTKTKTQVSVEFGLFYLLAMRTWVMNFPESQFPSL